jgi:6-pyruvoyltetrahydropterin/6-carboxytetrahydropterin synthase
MQLPPSPEAVPELQVSCREEFSAAHVLESPGLDAAANRRLYGPCADLHGHNYSLEVTVRGPVEPATGMVINFTDLFALVREEVLVPCDHKNLNQDVAFLEGTITTAENLAVRIWSLLEPRITDQPGCRLARIRISETSRTSVEYYGPRGVQTS